jgi:hypothetical protein
VRWFPHISAVLFIFSAGTCLRALANDGFYEGAGTTLVPVSSKSLRVVRERLEISALKKGRCFGLFYHGKRVTTGSDVKGDGPAEIGREVECKSANEHTFRSWFTADATYQIEATGDETGIQMGFPDPGWSDEYQGPDGLEGFSVPGVTGFEVAINGKRIGSLAQKRVKTVPLEEENQTEAELPAYVWSASFEKGKRYTVEARYEFGDDISAGFYPGRELPPEAKYLWFDRRPVAEAVASAPDVAAARTAIYYLHPIKLWAPPAPDVIEVRVEAPPDLPVMYLQTSTPGLRCIDTKALYFRWQHSYPDRDLRVSFPAEVDRRAFRAQPMKTDAEFSLWYETMNLVNARPGEKRKDTVGIGCDLVEALKRTVDKRSVLFTWFGPYGALKCVPSCDPEKGRR